MNGDATPGLTDTELAALAEAGISLDGPEGDPTGELTVQRGAARLQELFDESLQVDEAADILGATREETERMVSEGLVASVISGDGTRRPRWQFESGRLLPGLPAVLASAGTVHPFTLAAFMTRPNVDLELDGRSMTPVQWLSRGRDARLVGDLAFGLHGFH